MQEESEDLEDEKSSILEKAALHYKVVRHRYHNNVPGDILSMLNRKVGKEGKLREPSRLVQYLIFSNTASYLFYYRLWNGHLFLHETPDQGMPLDEAKHICMALLTQLLSKDSQAKVEEDSMTSAYMLDHLYYISLFKDFQGYSAGKVKLEHSNSVQDLQQLVLQDLDQLFCSTSVFSGIKTMPTKTSLVEGLLRYYDFLNQTERGIMSTAKTKGDSKYFSKKTQVLIKQISLGK